MRTATERHVPASPRATAAVTTEINVYFSANDDYAIYGTGLTPISNSNTTFELNPITNEYHAVFKVAAGEGAVWFKNNAGRTADADLYFYDRDLGAFYPEF